MRRFRLRRSLLAFLVFLAVPNLWGQEKSHEPWEGIAFSAEPKDIASAAANVKAEQYASITILSNERWVVFDSTDRGVSRWHLVYRVETKDALSWAGTVTAIWSSWRQKKPAIRARVIAPDGTTATLDPKVLTVVPAHDQRPEIYEDEQSLSGPLPSVGVGSIVEQEIVTEDTAPLFDAGSMRRFQVGYEDPVLHTLLELKAPVSSRLRYKVRGTPSLKITRSEDNGTVTLRFEQEYTPALEPAEKDLPADFESSPAIDYSTGASWNAVATRYSQEISAAVRPKEVGALMDGTSGLKGQELLRRIVTNLHRKVRYTGLEFGSSSLVPHSAGDVLKSGYGDCKDKAVVLVSALQAAGIGAELALLSSRGDDDDISPELAGLGLFDHAIVYIPGDPATWIDATAEFFEPGDLPWDDQGRLALLVGPETRDLVRIPVNQSGQNAEIVYRDFYLQDYGPAKIVETFEPVGEQSAYLGNYILAIPDCKA